MFRKYTLFEMKLLLRNRKNWFIAVFLLLFYLVFFMYYSQIEPESLKELKREEAGNMNATFEYIDELRKDVPEVAEVYNILTQQSSLINYQVYYLGIGDDSDEYIESGLKLNQLRLQAHELGNEGIPDHLVTPKEEILKENALLNYIKDHNLPIKADSFATNHFFVNALYAMSGSVFLIIVLISGSEILVYERSHQTVVKGFPLSFMKKVNSKVVVQFMQIYLLLITGFLAGAIYIAKKLEAGDLSFPILIYINGDYEAVSTLQYLLYIFLGIALVTILLLYASILLNMLFRNAFANTLIGLGIFILPDLFLAAGMNTPFLHPIKYIDLAKVLSGDLALQFENSQIDYWHAMLWLSILVILLIGIIYLINQFTYRRKAKDYPLEKAF